RGRRGGGVGRPNDRGRPARGSRLAQTGAGRRRAPRLLLQQDAHRWRASRSRATGERQMTHSTISVERHADRLARAQALLPEHDASALLIGWGTDLLWLVGYEAAASERMTML